MSAEIKNVMIIGGRGNLGPHIIRALVKADFTVSVLSRASSRVSDTTFLGATIVKSDYSYQSLVDVFTGQDAVVSTLSTADVAEQRIMIDAAAAAKVKRFIPSEFGIDTSVKELQTTAAFMQGKADMMDHIKSKEAEGMSWTAIFTGAWIDWMLVEGKGLLCLDVKAMTGELVDSGNEKFNTTTVAQVGEAAAAALLHSDKTKNQYVYVSSFETTQNKTIEAIERLSGRKFKLDKVDNKTLADRGMKHVQDGDWLKGYYELATTPVYSGEPITYFPEKAAQWMQELGLVQDETFDEMIARVLKAS